MRWLTLMTTPLLLSAAATESSPLPHSVDDGVPGFLAPFEQVEVGTTEQGLVVSCPVDEGDTVEADQTLIRLDDRLLRAALAIAEHEAAAVSERDAAAAELAVKVRRRDTLRQIAGDGLSAGEELARAEADVRLAEAQRDGAEERATAKRLEADRIGMQLRSRAIVAPIAGIVLAVNRRVGETVARADEPVAVIVDVRRLRATFHVPAEVRRALSVSGPVRLATVDASGEPIHVEGRVETISPITDAQSGTTRVRVIVDNGDGRLRAGTACRLPPR